ncbi:uncharacterized protein METZ01_LOCUS210885 [marine metagenome]|uniref:Uncharacterized protein n=1 Tax=marine metagenome TaxID=408172 RepID=A0A382F7E2_9ZZZZ
MNYLSQCNTDTIRMAINDAISEYSENEQINLRRISDKLRVNQSMYALYNTEKDQIASAINDALYLLDLIDIENHSQNRKANGRKSQRISESIDKSTFVSDADPSELAAYRDELERILEVLQRDSERSPRGE